MRKRRTVPKGKPFSIRFSKDVTRRLRERSLSDEIPVSFIIRDAVRVHLERYEAKREMNPA